MRDVLFLAWRYLLFHRAKTAILIASITITAALPLALERLVRQSAAQLTARAERSPLLLGARGSPIELVLNSLYFESGAPTGLRNAEVTRLRTMQLAQVVPVHARFRASGFPVVGTTLDYFTARALEVVHGRPFALLGECVLGAAVARSLALAPGDTLLTSPESVFDLAGVYPLRMQVVGVLAAGATADDRAVFVDVKTAWVIEGLGHGHQDLADPTSAAAILAQEDGRIVANASLVQFNEITPANSASFHFHGDLDEFPLTGALIYPHDAKAATLLRGRYLADDTAVQVVVPDTVMRKLLDTIFTVQSTVLAAALLLGCSTLATACLVFLLSVRLRRQEIVTMVKIGGSSRRIFAILAAEVLLVLTTSGLLASALAHLSERFGAEAIRAILLQ